MANESTAEFLASLDRLGADGAAVTHDAMQRLLESARGDLSMLDLNTLVDFTVHQIGRWQAKWLFSSAANPDSFARAEMLAWENLSDAFTKTLTDNVPTIKEQLQRTRGLVTGGYLIDRKLKDQGDSIASAAMSRLAIWLNRLGFRSIGSWLYVRALFPDGSVGRSGE